MRLRKLLIISALAMSLTVSAPAKIYAADNSYKVTYDKKVHDASDLKVKFTLNGDNIQTNYPGIITENDTSVASVKDVFVNSGMGITYKYSSKNQKIILYRNNKRVSYTVGKNYAYVNGKKKSISAPAVFITFPGGIKRLCVPARFTAQSLGFTYTYNSKKATSDISGTINKAVNIKYNGSKMAYQGAPVIIAVDENEVNSDKNPGIYRYNTLMVPVVYTFQKSDVKASYKYNSKKKTVKLTYDDKKLEMTLGKTSAKLDGKKVTLPEAPVLVTYLDSGKKNILVPFEETADLLGIEKVSTTETTRKITLKAEEKKENSKEENKKTEKEEDKKETEKTEEKNDTETNASPSGITNDSPAEVKPETEEKKETNSSEKPVNGGLFTYTTSGEGTGYVTELSTYLGVQSGIPATIDPAVAVNTELINVTHIPDNNGDMQYSLYLVDFNQGYSSVTGSVSDGKLNLELGTTAGKEQNFSLSGGIALQADLTYRSGNGTSLLSFSAPGAVAFSLIPNGDGHSFMVKLYRNTVTAVTGEYKDGQYIINITGASPVKVNPTDYEGETVFNIPDVCNTIGSCSFSSDGTPYTDISSVVFSPGSNNSSYLDIRYRGLNYYVQESGNTTSIVFSPKTSTVISTNTVIPLPAGITENDIADLDKEYEHKKFEIIINGNHLDYYTSNSISYDGSRVSKVSTSLDNNNTVITFKTHDIEAYRMNYEKGSLSLQIGDPRELYSKIVVLDPGHGGSDQGASSGNVKEKDLTYSILYTKLKEYLDDSDLKVYWTRVGDTYPSLTERAEAAKKVGADFFISLHMNSASSSAKGTEVWYSSSNKNKSSGGLTSYTLSKVLCDNLTQALGSNNRGVKDNIFVVTKKNTVPAALVELGFISNSSERKKLVSDDYQEKAAKVIYDSIEQIFSEYPTGR